MDLEQTYNSSVLGECQDVPAQLTNPDGLQKITDIARERIDLEIPPARLARSMRCESAGQTEHSCPRAFENQANSNACRTSGRASYFELFRIHAAGLPRLVWGINTSFADQRKMVLTPKGKVKTRLRPFDVAMLEYCPHLTSAAKISRCAASKPRRQP